MNADFMYSHESFAGFWSRDRLSTNQIDLGPPKKKKKKKKKKNKKNKKKNNNKKKTTIAHCSCIVL